MDISDLFPIADHFYSFWIAWSSYVIINKARLYDVNKKSYLLHSLTEFWVAARLLFFQNWCPLLIAQISLPTILPPRIRGLERNRTARMEDAIKQSINSCLTFPIPLFLSSHLQTLGWGGNKGLHIPQKTSVTSIDTLSHPDVCAARAVHLSWPGREQQEQESNWKC